MIAFFYILLASFLIQKRAQHFRKRIKNTNDALDFTVIIPFRNEESKLPALLNCLKLQKHSPFEIIWVNDHSEDRSVELIQTAEINGQLIHLDEKEFGKKTALHKAISMVKTNYFLTLDADVTFGTDYFKNLTHLPPSDLMILPVVMKGKNWVGKFGAFEFMKLQTINFVADQIWRPIMASGANLLVKTSVYHEVNQLEKHKHIASGDDQFLLKEMVRQKKKITLIDRKKFSVYTAAPEDLQTLTEQRIRWAGKSKAVKDNFANLMGLTLISFQMIYFGYILYFLMTQNFEWASLTIGAKIVADFILYAIELTRFKSIQKLFLLPIFELFYPIYLVLILVLIVKKQTLTWKGRTV
jgi:glycosyltransferase involved in cell wall biosynthesis